MPTCGSSTGNWRRNVNHVGRAFQVRREAVANKVILITGASRGIGAATARLAAARGYDVCVNFNRNREAAAQVVHDVQAAGVQAVAVAADVSVESDVVRLFKECDASFGRLDALVNNAGILETQM